MSEDVAFDKRLKTSLEILLKTAGRSQGAIWLLEPKELWLGINIPESWESQLRDQNGMLAFLTYKAIRTGQPIVETGSPDIGAVLPLIHQHQVLGVLVLPAGAENETGIAYWQALLKPVARLISIHLNQSDETEYHQILQVHEFLNQLHRQEAQQDIQQTAAQLAAMAREISLAEDTTLILLDSSHPLLAIKKRLGFGGGWSGQVSLRLEDSLTHQALQNRQMLQGRTNGKFNLHPEIDALPDLRVESLICAPLIAGDALLGALQLVNPRRDLKNRLVQSCLSLLVNTLANALADDQQRMRLKISSAEMEASLWEITKSRNTLRALFDSIPASIYIIDRTYRILAINLPRSLRANSEPRELFGRKCYEALYKRSEVCPGCRVIETFTQAISTNRTIHEWLEGDRFLDWEVTTYPIQEKTNLPHQAILFEQDITEKRSLEANLIQSEKMAAVGQLAAGIAHEINNPLAAIIANTQILRRELISDSPDFMETLHLIETAGLRAANVVSGLLGISRKENKYEFEPLSLNDSIRAALSLVNHDLLRRSITVETKFQDDMPEIIASRTHLQSVWINLLVNSMDAIDKEKGHITVATRYTERQFLVTFEDNGKGIPAEYINRIFEPFFTTKAAGRGTGLGLAVTQRVIKEHQGEIHIESRLGQGVKISISLPDIYRV
ncbi:MAG: ATP-binding protein [Bellilinea sp.]